MAALGLFLHPARRIRVLVVVPVLLDAGDIGEIITAQLAPTIMWRCIKSALNNTINAIYPRHGKRFTHYDRDAKRSSIILLASATISSLRLFSRLVGLSGSAEVEPGK
jgi:hypothetical protein